MAPLVKEFSKYSDQFDTRVCVTGQHREMLDQVLALFEITPDHDLDIMAPDQDLYDITTRILLGLRDVQLGLDLLQLHTQQLKLMSQLPRELFHYLKLGHHS